MSDDIDKMSIDELREAHVLAREAQAPAVDVPPLNQPAPASVLVSDAISVAAATVKLPPFTPSAVKAWFVQVEGHFANVGIKSSAAKVRHVQGALDTALLTRILVWISTNYPEGVVTYDQLKAQLFELYSVKPAECTARILSEGKNGL